MSSQKRAVRFIFALILSLAVPQVGFSHANLVRSEPAPDSELERAPSSIRLEFSEPLESPGSEITILDPRGNEVGHESSVIDSDEPTVMTVRVSDELPNGTYTVVWRSLSAVDGHLVRGSFLFAVGEPLGDGALVTEQTRLIEAPLEPAARWLTWLGISAMLGSLVLHLVVLVPVYRTTGRSALFASRIEARRWLVSGVGIVAFLAGAILHLVSHSRLTGGGVIELLGSTAWGEAWVWRFGAWCAAALGLIIERRRYRRASHGDSADEFESGFEPIALIGGVGALIAITMTTHVGVASDIRTPAIIGYFFHLLASSVWTGVLICLAAAAPIVVRDATAETTTQRLRPIVTRAWVLGLVCLAAAAVTGVYLAWVQVSAHDAMQSPYGVTLAIKIIFVVPMIALGAIQGLWVRERIEADPSAAAWFPRIGRVEAGLAVLVLVTVGFTASLEPGRLYHEREGRFAAGSLVMSEDAEGANITLTVEPALVGSNRLSFELTDALDDPIEASDVSLQIYDYPRHYIHFDERARSVGDGRYVLERAALSVEGTWQIDAVIRRPDAFDARASFRFRILPMDDEQVAAPTLGVATAWLLLALQLLLIALIFVGAIVAVRAFSSEFYSEV